MIKLNNHRNRNRNMGVVDTDNGPISFDMNVWAIFRQGSGRGSKADQKDYKAFVAFINDQGPQQRELYISKEAWRAMLLRCYY